ncbi:unnamed protein product [marine sediment metagenome]|uniref:PAS domain-containing protein n=1 Tax=marine sediment metagenome TaxID=412755 RepID=X1R2Y1_9ZZZZ
MEHGGKVYGLLKLQLSGDASVSGEEQSLLQEVTDDIAFALHDMELEEERKRLEHNLNERVKELQCLYGIASIAERPGITLDELYQEVANLLPVSWQYPEITCGRITIGDKVFRTNNYRDSKWKLSADIKIHDAKIGKVEANYLEERPKLDEGPFMKEERLLIDAVAERLERITQRKQAGEALQIAEQNFRNSLDNSPLGIRIVTVEGELLYANQAILDIYGYGSIEELKKTPTKQRYTPESYTEYQERKEKRKLGKPVPSNYEISIVRKDGEVRHLAVFRKEVLWGGEIQFQALYQDITERKLTAEKLRRFEAISDRAGYGAGIITLEGDFTYVNESFAEMHGYTIEELIGKHFSILHAKEQMRLVERLRKKLMREGSHVAEEVWHKKKNGTVFPTLMTGTAIKDDMGKPLYLSETVIDITELSFSSNNANPQRGII